MQMRGGRLRGVLSRAREIGGGGGGGGSSSGGRGKRPSKG